jgi:hypothetical protein
LKSGVTSPFFERRRRHHQLERSIPVNSGPAARGSCSGFSLSELSDAHVVRSIPAAKSFGSYDGRLTYVSTSPLRGSMISAAPLKPAWRNASSAAFCRS